MPYVKRDHTGTIVAVSKESQGAEDEFIANNDSELLTFLTQGLDEENPLYYLIKSDLDLTRVLEDLIELLVSRSLINFTDLPEPAQQKLMERRKARSRLRRESSDAILIEGDEILKL